MSLSLVQDYSSEEDAVTVVGDFDDSSQDEGESSPSAKPTTQIYSQNFKSPNASLLPSPDDLFLEVTGPPEFLKSTSNEPVYSRPQNIWQPSPGVSVTSIYSSHPVTDLRQITPLGGVLEAKSLEFQQENSHETKDSAHPAADDTAVIARPLATVENNSTTETEKRSRSKIKDKERSKRMKGQSSHATWKSETEMHLRQQFD